jgi:uncharacterized membrane protein YvbJ
MFSRTFGTNSTSTRTSLLTKKSFASSVRAFYTLHFPRRTTMTKRNIVAIAILAILLIIVIVMNMSIDTNAADIRPVAEGSVQAPGSGVRIGNTQ